MDEVRAFPSDARSEVGYQLYKLQEGLEPSDWKPMPSVGIGVQEIRVHTGNEYRVIYVAKFAEAVYILHAFMKKAHRTAKPDIVLATERLKQVIASRRKW